MLYFKFECDSSENEKEYCMKASLTKVEIVDKKQQILLAAETCFLEKGFAGTPISTIAAKANVPKALIYHYFKNKEELWKEVKLHIAIQASQTEVFSVPPQDNLKDFLTHVVQSRIELYTNCPEISKMIHWQALEENENKSELGLSCFRDSKIMVAWLDAIQSLQEKGLMRLNVDPVLTIIMIAQSASAPFMVSSSPFGHENIETQKQKFQNMLIECFSKGLSPI